MCIFLDIQGDITDILNSIDFYQKITSTEGMSIDALQKKYLNEYLDAYKVEISSSKPRFSQRRRVIDEDNISDCPDILYTENGVYIDEDIEVTALGNDVEYVEEGVNLDDLDNCTLSDGDDSSLNTHIVCDVSSVENRVESDLLDFTSLFGDDTSSSDTLGEDYPDESEYEDYSDESNYGDFEDDDVLEESNYGDYADEDVSDESDYGDSEEFDNMYNDNEEEAVVSSEVDSSSYTGDFSNLFSKETVVNNTAESVKDDIKSKDVPDSSHFRSSRMFDRDEFISSKDLDVIDEDANLINDDCISVQTNTVKGVSATVSYKDVRDFVKKNPGCTVSDVKKYFSIKDIQKALMRVKIVEKKNRLYAV